MMIEGGHNKMHPHKHDVKPEMNLGNVVGEVLDKAKTNNIVININKPDLDVYLNKYWSEVRDVIPKDIMDKATKGGFRTPSRSRIIKVAGGPSAFYRPVLCEAVETYLNAKERQALVVGQLEFTEGINTYTIVANVTLEPNIIWKKKPGIDEPLTVNIPKQKDNAVELLVESQLRHAANKIAVLEPTSPDTKATEGMVAVVNCESFIEGNKWAPGCVSNAKWPVEKEYMKSIELYDAIVGMKSGESKSITMTLNDKFGQDSGRVATAHLHIVQLFNKKVAPIDDDLAISNGFKTLDEYKVHLTTKTTKEMADAKANLIRTMALNAVVNPDTVDMEPIPYDWMLQKAREIYSQVRSVVKTEEELLAQFATEKMPDGSAVSSKADILTLLAHKSAQQLASNLIIRSWGKMKKVEGDTRLEYMSEFNENVINAMISIANVTEVDLPKE